MKNTVLVTGAAGFIGSHVAEHCLRAEMEVIALDDLSGGDFRNVPNGAKSVSGDIKDERFIKGLFAENQFQHVYHLAAYAAEGLSHFIRRYNYNTNLIGSINILNEAVNTGVKCFVFTSSIAVYGKNQTPMTEEMTPLPEDPYGVSKYAFELDLAAAHELFGIDYVIFRPHNVYGERQNIADKYRNVIGIFINQLLSGQPMTIFGDGSQTRAFSHIDDVAPIIARAPMVPQAMNQVYNVGADVPYSVRELATQVAAAMDLEPDFVQLDARKEVLHAYADHRKVRETFGLGATVPLETGIRRMVEWAKAQKHHSPVRFGNIEVARNLPQSWR